MLHFYHHPMSPYSKKVFFLLEESGRAYDLKTIELEKKEHRQAAYLKVNPAGRVPAIKDGDFVLWESNAVLRYLVRRFSLTSLYPQTLQEQGEVDQWWEFCNHHVNKPMMDVVWHRFMVKDFGGKPDWNVVRKAEAYLERDLPVLERHLLGRNFLVGGALSLADINLLPFAHAGCVPLGLKNHFPLFAAWTERMETRQSWRNVVAYSG